MDSYWHHPSVRAALQLQSQEFCKYAVKLPKSWENVQPKKKYLNMNLDIQTVHLPTYASWLNPIEKLWRKLKQNVIHRHPFTDDVKELKNKTSEFLDQFHPDSYRDGSKDLLKYTEIFNGNLQEKFFLLLLIPFLILLVNQKYG